MLILFDIDATLIATSGVGVHSLEDAGRELHGSTFTLKGVEYAGRLDPLIMSDLLALNGIERSDANIARLRDGYRAHLARRLADWPHKRALPGVFPLIYQLAQLESITLGLLTGNYEDTGRLKLTACGINADRFPIRVWGDCALAERRATAAASTTPLSRNDLPPIAMRRYATIVGRQIDPAHVTIIGDTPHDVACAAASGCRALGVGTGMFTADQLRACGAAHAVDDLSDTAAVFAWLTSG